MGSMEKFERACKQYEKTTHKVLGDDIKAGIVLAQLAKSEQTQKNEQKRMIVEHLVMSSQRLNTYELVRKEITDLLLTQKYTSGNPAGEISALNKGGGRGSVKGNGRGEPASGTITFKFEGNCFVCGKKGHKGKDCWSKKPGQGGAKGGGKSSSTKGGPNGG